MHLIIIGGASGVGKTSLLEQTASKALRINTGSILKKYMFLVQRDDIRRSDWSIHEPAMTNDLSQFIISAFQNSQNVIIDTHFAAKLNSKNYRIGLKEKYIFDLGMSLFSEIKTNIKIQVVLITANPHDLLERRRMDSTRNRELIPSDCYNDLRANDIYSTKYKGEIFRAAMKIDSSSKENIKYYRIENSDFKEALRDLKNILGE